MLQLVSIWIDIDSVQWTITTYARSFLLGLMYCMYTTASQPWHNTLYNLHICDCIPAVEKHLRICCFNSIKLFIFVIMYSPITLPSPKHGCVVRLIKLVLVNLFPLIMWWNKFPDVAGKVMVWSVFTNQLYYSVSSQQVMMETSHILNIWTAIWQSVVYLFVSLSYIDPTL